MKAQKEKESPFKTPEGYFEGLEQAVFEKIEAQGVRKPAVVRLTARSGGGRTRLWMQWAGAVAAGVCLLLAAWWLLRPALTEVPLVAADLSEEEVSTYLLENADALEADELGLLCEVVPDQETQEPPDTGADSVRKAPVGPAHDLLEPEDLHLLLDQMSEEELNAIL